MKASAENNSSDSLWQIERVYSDEIMDTGEKENTFFEPHQGVLKTPRKQLCTSHLVLGEIQPDSGSLMTPTKPKEVPPGEPWTPTANLKMLISAASPEIRNRDQQRDQQTAGSGNHESKDCMLEQFSGDENEKTQPSRKDKSLGLLCHKFLARYPNFPNPAVNNDICLDEVAEELSVERRRIYDIVNVLESLHMVSRLAKNRYTWHGRHNLIKTFGALKRAGEENKYAEQILVIKRREFDREFDTTEYKNKETMATPPSAVHSDMCFVELPGMEFKAASVNGRKDKSLRVMSQKFVMLFLVSKPQIVSLEVAAKILIGEDQVEDLDKSKFKTKIRRLYDIANVLSSLDLIKKVHVTEEKGRKPAFKWTGPDTSTHIEVPDIKCVDNTTLSPVKTEELKTPKEQCAKNLFSSRGKQSFTRHPSLIKLAKSIENDRRKINSAPTSPVKSGTDQNSSSLPSKMAQLAAICKLHLEEQSKGLKKKMKRNCKSATSDSKLLPKSNSTSSLETGLPAHPPSLLPRTHSDFSRGVPVLLPHTHSGTPYAIYFHPSQVSAMAAQSPVFRAHGVLCSNGPGPTRSPGPESEDAPDVEGGNWTSHGASNARSSPETAEGQAARSEGVPDKYCKRFPVHEDSCGSKRLKGDAGIRDDVPGTLIPSGYLIPLAHLAPIGKDQVFSRRDNGTVSSEHTIPTSPFAGVIPVSASELSALNFPSLHMAPLKLMLSPSSLAAMPMMNSASTPLGSSPSLAPQSPSPAILNFTLQHMGLVSPGGHVSSSPGPIIASPRNSPMPDDLGVHHGQMFRHVSPLPAHSHFTGQPVTIFALQQPTVPLTPKGSQPVEENFFRTPGGVTMSASSSPSDPTGATKLFMGAVSIPQRKLDVGTEVL
ncbi:transcription factor E2F8 isoform X2 [Pleurodeles waltl]|uniref:transcription factor E2F8 isoform X2 n=1 Tax=Pleurodeles waltl TaxID=8319 RepID=UPI0037096576